MALRRRWPPPRPRHLLALALLVHVASAAYYTMPLGASGCPPGDVVDSESECMLAIRSLGMNPLPAWVGAADSLPAHCSMTREGHEGEEKMHWSQSDVGVGHNDFHPICRQPGTAVPTERDGAYQAFHVTLSDEYYLMSEGAHGCPDGSEITSQAECAEAINRVHYMAFPAFIGNKSTMPRYCSVANVANAAWEHLHWNFAPVGSGIEELRPVCKMRTPDSTTTVATVATTLLATTTATTAAATTAGGGPSTTTRTTLAWWAIANKEKSTTTATTTTSREPIGLPAHSATAGYLKLREGAGGCPPGQDVLSEVECAHAIKILGHKLHKVWVGDSADLPGSCSIDMHPDLATRHLKAGMHWNTRRTDTAAAKGVTPICRNRDAEKEIVLDHLRKHNIVKLPVVTNPGQSYHQVLAALSILICCSLAAAWCVRAIRTGDYTLDGKWEELAYEWMYEDRKDLNKYVPFARENQVQIERMFQRYMKDQTQGASEIKTKKLKVTLDFGEMKSKVNMPGARARSIMRRPITDAERLQKRMIHGDRTMVTSPPSMTTPFDTPTDADAPRFGNAMALSSPTASVYSQASMYSTYSALSSVANEQQMAADTKTFWFAFLVAGAQVVGIACVFVIFWYLFGASWPPTHAVNVLLVLLAAFLFGLLIPTGLFLAWRESHPKKGTQRMLLLDSERHGWGHSKAVLYAIPCMVLVSCAAASYGVYHLTHPYVKPVPKNKEPQFIDSGLADSNFSVITVDTQLRSHKKSCLGTPGMVAHNYGAHKSWRGVRTNVELYAEYLDIAEVKDDDKFGGHLNILVDGADMAYGGCSSADILSRYRTIVDASGGSRVVVGGDHAIYPGTVTNGAQEYRRFLARAQGVLSAFDLKKPLEDFNKWGDYRYANTGFFMGPVKDLRTVFKCLLEIMPLDDDYDDQFALAECMFRHPDLITIDYSGALILTMDGFQPGVLEKRGVLLRNVALDSAQCFAHFNAGTLTTMGESLGLDDADAVETD